MTRPEPCCFPRTDVAHDPSCHRVTRPAPQLVFGANAVDRDQLLAKLHLVQRQGCTGWLRHWWRIEDETTGISVASGRALTAWAATRRKHRAYLRELGR
jgi:hypothetical protein